MTINLPGLLASVAAAAAAAAVLVGPPLARLVGVLQGRDSVVEPFRAVYRRVERLTEEQP